MRRVPLVAVPAALVALLALAACSPAVVQPAQGEPTGEQGGATGPQGTSGAPAPYQQLYPYGPGGIMGPGMMDPGIMGGWGGYNPHAQQITVDDAAETVERYLSAYYGQDLALAEVMEFAWNFYAEVEEQSTGVHAMELLVDKYTGQISPEMGPNMMWNTKYGTMAQMMGGYGVPTAEMPIGSERSRDLAQQFLNASGAALQTGEAEAFYGYYTLHTLRNGQVEGMLSVNGYTGQAWYHTWHGPFIGMKEFH